MAEAGGPFLIGGKSLGGRVAAMASAEVQGRATGVICLGYPFHPPGKPESTRLPPLAEAPVPVLVCQGDRDPFGNAANVAGYALPSGVDVVWHDDGDHDLKPRGRAEATWQGNLDQAADAVAAFARKFGQSER